MTEAPTASTTTSDPPAPAPAPTPETPGAPPPGAPAPDPTPEAPGLLRTSDAPLATTPFDPASFTYPEVEGVTFSDEDKTAFAGLATKYGVSAEAATAFLQMHAESLKTTHGRVSGEVQTAWNETLTGWTDEVKKTYGAQLEEVITGCEAVIDQFGGQAFREFLGITGGHSHPAVFAFLKKVGEAVGEAKPVMPQGSAAADRYATMYPSMATLQKGNG